MKFPLVKSLLALVALLTPEAAHAASTLMFTLGSNQATNFANGNGQGGTNLAWGIIIDTAGDGFDSNYRSYDSNYQPTGVNFGNITAGQSLVAEDGSASDDVLFMSSQVMNLVMGGSIDGIVVGQNRITSVANLPYNALQVHPGQTFVIAWFDHTSAQGQPPAGTPFYEEKFGTFSNPLFVIPPDGGITDMSSAFTGADPLKSMNHRWTPEPSTSVLALLGTATLMRRRRFR